MRLGGAPEPSRRGRGRRGRGSRRTRAIVDTGCSGEGSNAKHTAYGLVVNRLAVFERRILILHWSPEGARMRTAWTHLRALSRLRDGTSPRVQRDARCAVVAPPVPTGRHDPAYHLPRAALDRRLRAPPAALSGSPSCVARRSPFLRTTTTTRPCSTNRFDELGVDVVFTPMAEARQEETLLPLTAQRVARSERR